MAAWYDARRCGRSSPIRDGCTGSEYDAIPTRGWTILLFVITAAPAIVLAPFEAYFAVRRYRAIRREMDERTVLA